MGAMSGRETALPGRFLAAPMAEISHAGYRQWCEDYGGADFYVTEMIGVRALVYGSAHLPWYTESRPVDGQTVFQLWGVHVEDFAAALPKLARFPVPGVDVNMGCCAPLIRTKGGGISLMSDPDKAARIIETLVKGLPEKTVSAKMRIGEEEDGDVLVSFARRLESAGAGWIALNPRTRRDKHHRPAKWDYVRLLKENLGIPVVGNGDIADWESFRARRDRSGADAFMIGRAAVARPWLFSHLRERERSSPASPSGPPLRIDRSAMVEAALVGIEEWQPPESHVGRAKRFLSFWTRQLKFGNRLYLSIVGAGSLDAMRGILDGYFLRNPDEAILTVERPSSSRPEEAAGSRLR